MATIEERLQALEQEHTQLKKTIELQTIAIRALVSKEAFEKLQSTVEKSQEQNGKLFDTLITHDRLINEQLVELRTFHLKTDSKIAELDGKVVGLQAEMRQTAKQTEIRFENMETRFGNMETRLDRVETLLTQILERLPEK